jgi:hypothetical protein
VIEISNLIEREEHRTLRERERESELVERKRTKLKLQRNNEVKIREVEKAKK